MPLSANVRVLFDANLWISASITDGFSRRVIRAAMKTEVVVTSPELIADVVRKLRDPLNQPEILVDATERTMKRCHVFDGPCDVLPRCRDADDDILIAQAIVAGCNVLVTRDKDLLVLGSVGKLRIMKPGQFARIIGVA